MSKSRKIAAKRKAKAKRRKKRKLLRLCVFCNKRQIKHVPDHGHLTLPSLRKRLGYCHHPDCKDKWAANWSKKALTMGEGRLTWMLTEEGTGKKRCFSTFAEAHNCAKSLTGPSSIVYSIASGGYP